MLYDVALVSRDLTWVTRDKNTFALALVLWFDYQSDTSTTGFLLCDKVIQVKEFVWGDPGFRKEIIVIWKGLLHQFQILGQIMFQGNQVHGWEMINHLMRLHALELFR